MNRILCNFLKQKEFLIKFSEIFYYLHPKTVSDWSEKENVPEKKIKEILEEFFRECRDILNNVFKEGDNWILTTVSDINLSEKHRKDAEDRLLFSTIVTANENSRLYFEKIQQEEIFEIFQAMPLFSTPLCLALFGEHITEMTIYDSAKGKSIMGLFSYFVSRTNICRSGS